QHTAGEGVIDLLDLDEHLIPQHLTVPAKRMGDQVATPDPDTRSNKTHRIFPWVPMLAREIWIVFPWYPATVGRGDTGQAGVGVESRRHRRGRIRLGVVVERVADTPEIPGSR